MTNHVTRRPSKRVGRLLGCCVLLFGTLLLIGPTGLGGCGPQRRSLFDAKEQLVWPPAPEPTRVRLLGELRGAESLKRRPNVFESVGELFAGKAAIGGEATAYDCRAFTCALPTTDPAALV